MRSISNTLAAAALACGFALPAAAQQITGAGATLPAPVYAKWVEAYKAQTGVGLNYQAIGSGGGIALTRQLAAEGAWHGIRVNCISPGMVMTPATQDDIFGNPDHPMYGIRDNIPLGRIGTPEDIAACALFLAGDESSYMSGANLVIDGGWWLGIAD